MGKENDSRTAGKLGWLLVGAGLGALTSYLMDPDRGRRRQAMLRDHVVHAGEVVQQEVPKKIQAAQQKLQEVQQGVGSRLGGKSAEETEADPTSPEWEIAHNDDGSLTGPSY
ncbi:MAG TPA: YtxH domain-containing protein [Chloroflexia bacterium]|nr:YtxH domain-containing protein [Chloroflexia bacterium]